MEGSVVPCSVSSVCWLFKDNISGSGANEAGNGFCGWLNAEMKWQLLSAAMSPNYLTRKRCGQMPSRVGFESCIWEETVTPKIFRLGVLGYKWCRLSWITLLTCVYFVLCDLKPVFSLYTSVYLTAKGKARSWWLLVSLSTDSMILWTPPTSRDIPF